MSWCVPGTSEQPLFDEGLCTTRSSSVQSWSNGRPRGKGLNSESATRIFHLDPHFNNLGKKAGNMSFKKVCQFRTPCCSWHQFLLKDNKHVLSSVYRSTRPFLLRSASRASDSRRANPSRSSPGQRSSARTQRSAWARRKAARDARGT